MHALPIATTTPAHEADEFEQVVVALPILALPPFSFPGDLLDSSHLASTIGHEWVKHRLSGSSGNNLGNRCHLRHALALETSRRAMRDIELYEAISGVVGEKGSGRREAIRQRLRRHSRAWHVRQEPTAEVSSLLRKG